MYWSIEESNGKEGEGTIFRAAIGRGEVSCRFSMMPARVLLGLAITHSDEQDQPRFFSL